MKQIIFCLLISFLSRLNATAQIKTTTVQNPSLLKTTVPDNQATRQNKSNAATQSTNTFVNMNTLTAANPKIEGLAEFTFKGGDYSDASKKLFIHGCANLSGFPCLSGPCYCTAGATIKILNKTNTQFRVDVIVNFDKGYYKDDPFVSASKLPDGNNYFYSARGPDSYREPLYGTNIKVLITDNNPTNAAGVKKLTLVINKKTDGSPFSAADFKNIEIYLSADYAFELRSITVTPL